MFCTPLSTILYWMFIVYLVYWYSSRCFPLGLNRVLMWTSDYITTSRDRRHVQCSLTLKRRGRGDCWRIFYFPSRCYPKLHLVLTLWTEDFRTSSWEFLSNKIVQWRWPGDSTNFRLIDLRVYKNYILKMSLVGEGGVVEVWQTLIF